MPCVLRCYPVAGPCLHSMLLGENVPQPAVRTRGFPHPSPGGGFLPNITQTQKLRNGVLCISCNLSNFTGPQHEFRGGTNSDLPCKEQGSSTLTLPTCVGVEVGVVVAKTSRSLLEQ